MNKAFIFDMDGVLINNEPLWNVEKKEVFTKLFGEEIYAKMGSTVGVDTHSTFKRAVGLGATIALESFLNEYCKRAPNIYTTAPVTEGVEKLAEVLIKNNYAIGIVSASPREWIEMVVNRLSFKDKILVIISLEDSPDLKKKPAPDGYLKAMKDLGVTPSDTIILEDSNAGITSAKSSGAFTIALTQNLVEGYQQIDADAKANNMEDVIEIVSNYSK